MIFIKCHLVSKFNLILTGNCISAGLLCLSNNIFLVRKGTNSHFLHIFYCFSCVWNLIAFDPVTAFNLKKKAFETKANLLTTC